MKFTRKELLDGGASSTLFALKLSDGGPGYTAVMGWWLEAIITWGVGSYAKLTQAISVELKPDPERPDGVVVSATEDIVFEKPGHKGHTLAELYIVGPMGRARLNFPPKGRPVLLKGGDIRIRGDSLTLARGPEWKERASVDIVGGMRKWAESLAEGPIV